MRIKYQKKNENVIKIAKERIETLFKEAKDIYKSDKSSANRYVELARKIGMKYKVNIPSNFKRKFCKHCYIYLVPGDNCRVRTVRGNVVYYCLDCKNYMKIGYNPQKKKITSKNNDKI